jgi:hypothetical protein
VGVDFSPDGTRLASGGFDGTVLLWGIPAEEARTAPADPTPMDRLWEILAGKDAAKAYEAILEMSARPDETLRLLEDRLLPDRMLSPEDLQRLVRDLDADDFPVRQEADRHLRSVVEDIEEDLRQALAGAETPEARARLQAILDSRGIPFDRFPCEALRTIRSVEVLDRIGTSDAQDLLGRIARDAPTPLERAEAEAALQRCKTTPIIPREF